MQQERVRKPQSVDGGTADIDLEEETQKSAYNFKLHFIYYVCVGVRDQRTSCCRVSSYTTWVPGNELRSSCLVAGAFTTEPSCQPSGKYLERCLYVGRSVIRRLTWYSSQRSI